jgi:hypothetical protein
MNAISLIDQLRKHGAEIGVENDRLVIRGDLPNELRDELTRHNDDLLIALGHPIDSVVNVILEEVRPNLPPSFRSLSGDKLRFLVRWSLLTSWNAEVRRREREQGTASAKRRKRG